MKKLDPEKSSLPVRTIAIGAVVASLLALLSLGWRNVSTIDALSERNDAVVRTHEAISHIEKTSALIQRAAAERRSYTLSGEEEHYQAFLRSIDEVPAALGRVRALLVDARALEKLDVLERETLEGIATVRAMTERTKAEGFDLEREKRAVTVAHTALAHVQAGLDDLVAHESRLLAERGEAAVARANASRNETWQASAASLLMFLIAVLALRREARRRRRVESSFRSLVDHASEGIFVADAQGRCTEVNAAGCKLLGMGREEILGRAVADLMPAEDLPRLTRARERVYAGETEQARWTLLHKDGTPIPVDIVANVLPDGLLLAFVGDARPAIEAASKLRAKEQESAERVERVLAAAPDAMLVVDERGRVVQANDQAVKLFGHSMEELLAIDVEALIPEQFRATHRDRRGHFRTTPVARPMGGSNAALTALRKDGTEFPADISLSPLRTGDGPLAIASVRDATERREQEAALRRAIETAESANRELEAFSYSVAHDLRSPIRAMDAFALATIEDFGAELPSEAQSNLERIRVNARRMGELIDDLLSLARVSRAGLARQSLDLGTIANEVIRSLEQTNPSRHVTFHVSEEMQTTGDPRLLQVLLENLLGNAWKFTSKKDVAHVDVGVTTEDGERVFLVRDDGAGFGMRYAGKLFGVFQRLHRASEFEGTGIGLATVDRIVRKHGGRVWAKSEEGRGATFFFSLGAAAA